MKNIKIYFLPSFLAKRITVKQLAAVQDGCIAPNRSDFAFCHIFVTFLSHFCHNFNLSLHQN
jgi:hypothetical protein